MPNSHRDLFGQDLQYYTRFILAKVAKNDHALQLISAEIKHRKYSPAMDNENIILANICNIQIGHYQ
jgi:hypothetical protein